LRKPDQLISKPVSREGVNAGIQNGKLEDARNIHIAPEFLAEM
jgi:hypothetical protein